MPIVFNGVDNEFAVSTGNNVNTTANSSTFDNPPQGSKDLVITSNTGDSDPRFFELGDSYDVQWGGQGGGFLEDAVVIRSDLAPNGTGGIIVFEGLDENGDLAQVVWTPGFDLEGWYADNYNPSAEPQFYTQDEQSEYSHSVVCFSAETRIHTPCGTELAGRLREGDLVITRDKGAQPIRWVGRRRVKATGRAAPVEFARARLGNTRPLRVSQQHRILVRSSFATPRYGSEEVLLPSKAFLGSTGTRIAPRWAMTYVHLLLDQHHILQAEGAACESLYLGRQAQRSLSVMFGAPQGPALPEIDHICPARPLLSVRQGRELLADMEGCETRILADMS